MTDSLGHIRWYFTPLVTYIVDMPEAVLIAGVGGKTSHLTLASHKSFGDHFWHPTRLATLTLAQIEHLSEMSILGTSSPMRRKLSGVSN